MSPVGDAVADPIADLLAGRYPDPDGGPPLSIPLRSIVIADRLDGMEAGLVMALGLGRRLAVVSDPDTHAALGARVEAALASVAEVRPIRLSARPHAGLATAEAIGREAESADALVAVGSGTINDLCKHAAARARKPAVVFGTAPSMNGYTSASAAIMADGLKRSLPAAPPVAVFLDLTVLAAAPARLIRAGVGDSLCRPTAQADWRLAHLVRGRPYREAPFALLAGDEAALLAEPEALLAGDLGAMRRLARTLVLSGLGMTICGSSEPASQGEHLVSHYAEMRAPADWPSRLHGEQVGVATLTMARLQARLLDGPPPRLGPTAVTEADLVAHFGPDLGRACWRECLPKRLDPAAADALTARLDSEWDRIRSAIVPVTRPAAHLERTLRRLGAPARPEDLGWSPAFYRDAVLHAREIRNRYTFLDLAGDAGLLPSAAGA